MRTIERPMYAQRSRGFDWGAVPWQIWVVSAILAVEGLLSNLPLMFSHPVAAIWLAAKVLFITGFFLRWRPVFVIFILEGLLHMMVFSMTAPFVAFINLAMVILVGSTLRYFFPPATGAGAVA